MKRAQAAMEFLTTYGWAILVVLAVVTALAYLGILNPESWAESRCVGLGELSCADWSARSDGGITLMIVPAREIYLLSAEVNLLGSSDNVPVPDCGVGQLQMAIPAGGSLLDPTGSPSYEETYGTTKRLGGNPLTLRLDCSASSWPANARVDADVTINFQFTNSNIVKSETLELRRLRVS